MDFEGVLCRLCTSGDVALWRRKRGFSIFRCRACGNGFIPEQSIPADLEKLYRPEYFSGGVATGYPSYRRDAAVIERNFTARLARLEAQMPPGRLLDVGAAYGFCLKVARERGWRPMGVEIAAECATAAERLAGVPVIAADFLTAELTGPFDAITMFDVLEHFRDPAACVARALELLAPGGALVIETGDLASRWARLLGGAWYFLDPPQHLTYFTAAGLVNFLERRGFAPGVQIERIGRWVSLANVAFKLAHHAPLTILRRPAARLAARALPGAVYVNFRDVVLLLARRPAGSR